ncbi:hypothetical protein L6452_18918 [Arctium lappa]|uniref:Uncharacterized protein n=3 Tax=Arctium lappa TaxID=4217 RepID=A0ACB9B7Z7_ARCLA|nr:hypothetical protein L6452_18904 [Arctium lappa]KAI3718070.1 hypothetical protein L6452_18917 [Arctium lappa]KAI3718071.1 hypothetical protein L6452_18918 [Arctium lappa]
MTDNDLENLIIPSSSADENPSFTTPSTKSISADLMKKVHIPTPPNKKQSVELPKKRKLKEGVPNNYVAMRTSLEEEAVGGPHMTKQEYEARFPHVNLGITLMYPYNEAVDDAKDMIRDCMVFISPDELNEIEDEWRDYYREDLRRSDQRSLLLNKQSKLIEKATRAYNDSLKQ